MNGNQLKLIAIAAMTIGHVAWVLQPGVDVAWYLIALQTVLRLMVPIMWFFVAEGCAHTRNIWMYALRMGIFAVVSHFAYCFAFGVPFFGLDGGFMNRTSVLWPLGVAVLLIAILENTYMSMPVQILVVLGFCVLAFPGDWSCIALLAPVFLYFQRGNRQVQMIGITVIAALVAGVGFIIMDWRSALLNVGLALSVPLLMTYNGERGRWRGMKWLFYIYYPAHLAVCGVLRILLHGDISLF